MQTPSFDHLARILLSYTTLFADEESDKIQ